MRTHLNIQVWLAAGFNNRQSNKLMKSIVAKENGQTVITKANLSQSTAQFEDPTRYLEAKNTIWYNIFFNRGEGIIY